ncbi:MAG TPA: type 4a pilus biogenesis protein PilO [Gemmatimonadota bacterium]|nr:type 4a pilus biogenesis protein PilO [Gemmatimonadota bacterium]
MPLTPQDPRDQRRLLGILAALVVFVAFWMYVYKPKKADLNELEDRVAQIEYQNRLAQARTGNLDAMRQELDREESVYVALQKLVPERSEIPAIYESIAQESQSLGLELEQVVPAAPTADSASYFMHQDWQMQVKGDYQSVGQFLTRVASFRRIVRPEVTELRPEEQTPSGRQLVSARMSLQTYVIPPDTSAKKASGGDRAGG